MKRADEDDCGGRPRSLFPRTAPEAAYCNPLSLLTMSLRRAAPPLSATTAALTQPVNGLAAARETSSKPSTRRNTYVSAAVVVFLVGAYLRTLSPSSSSSSSSHKSSTFLRSSTTTAISTKIPNFEPIHEQCSVWIAPTSLKGVIGYGVFTTRDLDKKEYIIGRPDGVAVPVEFDWDKHAPLQRERDKWSHVWGNYVWGRGVPDHARYYAGPDVYEYQIAFGALPNHHCILESLDYVYPVPPYDDSMVDRFTDPGAGAFTYNRGRQFTVSRPLKAGSEIFLNYGYCQHGSRHNPDWVDHVYVTSDYSQAASLIWNTIQGGDSSLRFDEKQNLIAPDGVNKLVLELLPQTSAELDEIGKDAKSRTDLTWYLAIHKSLVPRSPDDIRSSGMCLESLLPFLSSLPHAGQGAFAQYPISAGDIVIPAPLLQIIDKGVLDIYENGNLMGTQLLLNYCFGHPESTFLLCPDTQAELINHCSKRKKQCGRHGPNAAIRWSRGWDPASDTWREKSLEEIAKEPGRGLAFEVYALRNIEAGEEVFIDYGVEWENAWEKHVQSWTPPRKPEKHWITAKEANDNMEEILPEFISGDLRKVVEHPYLFTVCQYYPSEADEDEVYQESYDEWIDKSDEQILAWYADTSEGYGYYKDRGYPQHGDFSHWPCSVLYEEQVGTYTVRIHQSQFDDTMPWEDNGVPRILTSYSRANIHYFVKPFAADQFLPGAFRKELGIPDDMFPEHWKNLK